ncbi:nucleoside-triphosphatase [Natrarchaeobaculum sulfurireducens]|uniref:Nucleoside-triphosphatase AArc1_0783 n=1 Tax=Natrarchaeobaculum sulfurireducens TaxID=2044521 RepID=A0A346PC80_9EURY|nr:nucleoside-triphosphatase [Natrarchaeobaculum sulfurireducens]AXR77125.1 Nucleoside-triphosphatase THEP1 [Natrarchaeobaculum sulfurireducens]AXR82909.1 putative nucleotide kinase [Natrarchaeobaculum sulfurireducens]
MSGNALVTGPPRSGKTTTLERAVDRLREDDLTVGGVVCPEIRVEGERVGFEITDLGGRRRATMAHVDVDGPRVGKYGVDVPVIDRVVSDVIPPALTRADCIVIDEVAPMQLESERFVEVTLRALESETPVLAAIATGSRGEFLYGVREREDVEIVAVEPETRDELPDRLATWVRSTG